MMKAAQARTGKIQDAARQDADLARAEGARVAKETRRTAEAFRAQTEQEARHLLEEAREATDQLWKETERDCALVDREARRLEGCGSGPRSSSGGCTATWSRSWRRSVSVSMASRT